MKIITTIIMRVMSISALLTISLPVYCLSQDTYNTKINSATNVKVSNSNVSIDKVENLNIENISRATTDSRTFKLSDHFKKSLLHKILEIQQDSQFYYVNKFRLAVAKNSNGVLLLKEISDFLQTKGYAKSDVFEERYYEIDKIPTGIIIGLERNDSCLLISAGQINYQLFDASSNSTH